MIATDWLHVPVARVYGRLTKVNGLMLEAVGCRLATGERCHIECKDGSKVEAEVVGFYDSTLCLMPVTHTPTLLPGARVIPLDDTTQIPIGEGLKGRVIDGLGNPIDELGPLTDITYCQPRLIIPNPLKRKPITQKLDVGVRAINGLLPIGRGQRIGVFAGPGVGKSVLLGMMTKFTEAEIIVVGLIGERGREVREFIEDSLGEDGRKRAVVIVAPADNPPLMRLRAMRLCHQIAAQFRDNGKHVLLLVDSLTRYAQAQREIALTLGEPPATKGYPPSAFAQLPSLVEMAGNGEHNLGTLTAFYTVLAEGDDQQDPIADAARAILDGHFILSRKLAEAGHFPAIDINASVSRLVSQISEVSDLNNISRIRSLLSRYREVQELLPLGGYQKGNDIELDLAVKYYSVIAEYLKQNQNEAFNIQNSIDGLTDLLLKINNNE